MDDVIYKKSFGLFLKRTDEKSVIKRFIGANIPINKQTNFLDIGGGDGSLAALISKQVRTTLVVEPNRIFFKQLLKQKRLKVLNAKWENVRLVGTFDFILAAYVVTYFPPPKIRHLIKKMHYHLRPGGRILILAVDAKMGSWRKIHTYFYKLAGIKHKSSDNALKQIARDYKAVSKSFKTHVVAKNANEMLDILGFDFNKYPQYFLKFSGRLLKFLNRYTDKSGKITLTMAHNGYIFTKK